MRFRVLLAATAVLAGCGSDGSEGTTAATGSDRPTRPAKLPPSVQRSVFLSQQAITGYCRRLDASLKGATSTPGAGARARALRSADRLARLARERPFELVQTGVDVRLYVADLVEDLGNLACEAEIAARLEAGLR